MEEVFPRQTTKVKPKKLEEPGLGLQGTAADKNQTFGNLIQGYKRKYNIKVHFTTTASATSQHHKNRKHRLKSSHIFGSLSHNLVDTKIVYRSVVKA